MRFLGEFGMIANILDLEVLYGEFLVNDFCLMIYF